MAIPSNPSIGQVYTNDITNVSYKWTGDRWIMVSTTLADLDSSFVTIEEFDAEQDLQDELYVLNIPGFTP